VLYNTPKNKTQHTQLPPFHIFLKETRELQQMTLLEGQTRCNQAEDNAEPQMKIDFKTYSNKLIQQTSSKTTYNSFNVNPKMLETKTQINNM
jgi:hypothetical protein